MGNAQRLASSPLDSDISDRIGIRQEAVSTFENKPKSTKTETPFKLLSALDLELQIVPKGETS